MIVGSQSLLIHLGPAINGANIGMPKDFGLHVGPHDPERNAKDLWVFGTLIAIPFLAGGSL